MGSDSSEADEEVLKLQIESHEHLTEEERQHGSVHQESEGQRSLIIQIQNQLHGQSVSPTEWPSQLPPGELWSEFKRNRGDRER